MRKFYKAVFSIEVLSEEPIDEMSIDDIKYEITEGNCSGVITKSDTTELTGLEMAKALLAQGSDAEFFQLDDDGNDLREGDANEDQ